MTARTGAQPNFVKPEPSSLPWRERAFNNINVASEALGVSRTSIYRLASQGKLTLRRVAGRVVVETAGLLAIVQTAEPWTPSDHGAGGRAKRAELARARWQG